MRKVPNDKLKDAEFLASVGLVATNNKAGCMFLQIDEYVNEWIKTNVQSDKPLADLGCAYGIHTIHALKKRDVISVDMDATHIAKLKETVWKEQGLHGKLINTHVARLPCSELFEDESISGALLSEVMHFLKPGEPLAVLKDIFRWLVPGASLFVSTASEKGFANKTGARMQDGRSEKEMMEFVSKASDKEIIDASPTFTTFSDRCEIPSLYFLTEKELGALACLAGFEILTLRYYSPRKYQVLYAEANECLLLIARKPMH